MDAHLEHLALMDMDARQEYARELTRRGDARGQLLELACKPSWKAWLEIVKPLEICDQDTTTWLSQYLGHWLTRTRRLAVWVCSSALPARRASPCLWR